MGLNVFDYAFKNSLGCFSMSGYCIITTGYPSPDIALLLTVALVVLLSHLFSFMLAYTHLNFNGIFILHAADILNELLQRENRVLHFWTMRKKRLDQCQQYVVFERSAKQVRYVFLERFVTIERVIL